MNPVDEHRDPEVDAAWRAASGEHPPASLDATIAAAARRAVGAGPRAYGARSWWPVAAAAVVAVVAIGIVEMTPPEQIAPTTMPAEPPPPLPVQPAPPRDTMRDQHAPAPAIVAPAPSRAAEPSRKTERASPAAKQSAPAASEVPAIKAGNPFPASPSDRSDATPAPIDRASETSARLKARQEAAPASAGAGALQAPANAAKDFRESAPAAAAGALAPRSETSKPASAPPALAKPAHARATAEDEATQRSIEEWIALIRRLKADGRTDLAAKELAAFRARYQDRADALLPADLREPRP